MPSDAAELNSCTSLVCTRRVVAVCQRALTTRYVCMYVCMQGSLLMSLERILKRLASGDVCVHGPPLIQPGNISSLHRASGCSCGVTRALCSGSFEQATSVPSRARSAERQRTATRMTNARVRPLRMKEISLRHTCCHVGCKMLQERQTCEAASL